MDFDLIFRKLVDPTQPDPTRRRLLDALVKRDGQTLFELMARLFSRNEGSSSRQSLSKLLGLQEESGPLPIEWR